MVCLDPIWDTFVPIVDPELIEFCVLPPNYTTYPKIYIFLEARKLDQSMLLSYLRAIKIEEIGNNDYQDVKRKLNKGDTIKHIVELCERKWEGDNFDMTWIGRELNYPNDLLSRVESVNGGHMHEVKNKIDLFHGLLFRQ
ncbi:hypothetical protein MKX03_002794 [Papaver bracteatum]|nr:hypothetical protein MKX03_002794 [Papaver bracteatum]